MTRIGGNDAHRLGQPTDAEAITMTNDTEFGLAAYFYSRDFGRIWRVAEAPRIGNS
jgi:acyl-CoA reductase-like NAD-dependent aldehyde dehydrogenase